MVYMGSKAKLAKYLKPIIENYLKDKQVYIEPFVGGANLIDKIDFENKIGYDINHNLIDLLNHYQQNPQTPYYFITRETFFFYRQLYELGYHSWIIGYVGFIGGFCGKFFDSYGHNDKSNRNQIKERHNNLLKQAKTKGFQQVVFKQSNYKDLHIENAVIYLDPPYINTTKYRGGDDFNFTQLERKCTYWSQYNNIILLSEVTQPSHNWDIVFEKDYIFGVGGGNKVNVKEKLFIWNEKKDY